MSKPKRISLEQILSDLATPPTRRGPRASPAKALVTYLTQALGLEICGWRSPVIPDGVEAAAFTTSTAGGPSAWLVRCVDVPEIDLDQAATSVGFALAGRCRAVLLAGAGSVAQEAEEYCRDVNRGIIARIYIAGGAQLQDEALCPGRIRRAIDRAWAPTGLLRRTMTEALS